MEEGDGTAAAASGGDAGDRAVALIIASSVVSGLACFLGGARTRRPLSAAFGAAHGALKVARGVGELRFPALRGLKLAVKVLIKGYKASKRFNLVAATPGGSSTASRKLIAYLRALNVARYARCFLFHDGAAGVGFLRNCYKLSRNLPKALEDFSCIRLHSTLRESLDAVALSIKIALVAVELERIAIAARRGKHRHCRSVRRGAHSGYAVRSKPRRTAVDRGSAGVERFAERSSLHEQTPAIDLSGLLCLSIPLIHENIPSKISPDK